MCYNIFERWVDDMSKRGFTLIELLVVIIIMGLITFLGFPALMRTLTTNSTREFELYGESMIAGAKLYMQKEGYDLQEEEKEYEKINGVSGDLRNGGHLITLDDLIDGEYVSEFKSSRKNHSCYKYRNNTVSTDVNNISGVRVKLTDHDTYKYTYQLFCKIGDKAYIYEFKSLD